MSVFRDDFSPKALWNALDPPRPITEVTKSQRADISKIFTPVLQRS